MKSFIMCLIIFGEVCFNPASPALTTAEKNVGLSIASTLDNLLTPTSSFKSMSSSGARLESRSLDFMLLLDTSGSINLNDFNEGKEATEVIVDFIDNKSPISCTGTRVGLIRFSFEARVVFSFGDYNCPCEVKRAIDQVEYDEGWATATALALTSAKTEFNTNGRVHNAKVIWILTDGKSNRGGSPITPANQLKNMGVTICAVAIGGDVNMAEINSIASSDCVFQLTSFSKYKEVMKFAYSQSGGAPKSPTVGPDFFKGMQFRK